MQQGAQANSHPGPVSRATTPTPHQPPPCLTPAKPSSNLPLEASVTLIRQHPFGPHTPRQHPERLRVWALGQTDLG